jgi:hypothetical protein
MPSTISSKYVEEKTKEVTGFIYSKISAESKQIPQFIDALLDDAYDLNIAGKIPMENGVNAIKTWAESFHGTFDTVKENLIVKKIGENAEMVAKYFDVTESVLAYREILAKIDRESTTSSVSNRNAVIEDPTNGEFYLISYNGMIKINNGTVPLIDLKHLCKLSDEDYSKGELNDASFERWIRTKILLSVTSAVNNNVFAKKLARYFDGKIRPYTNDDISVFSGHVLSKNSKTK